ncbi:MAG: phage holin family protein [Chthoniobacteraceae bacterium]
MAGYAKARLALVGIEGKEAAIHYAVILGLVLAAAVLSVFGYVFVVITIVFAIAAAAGGGNAWLWVVGSAALLHLAVAAGILFFAWRRLKAPMLEFTLEELRKDKEWLNDLARKP